MIAKAPIPVAKPSIVLARANPDPAAILRGEIPTPSNHSGGYVTPASFVVPAVSAPRITQVTQSVPQAAHHDSWAVQIGSYHEPDRAHAQARAATRWVAGEVAVVEVEISNRTVYRARLVGFQKNRRIPFVRICHVREWIAWLCVHMANGITVLSFGVIQCKCFYA